MNPILIVNNENPDMMIHKVILGQPNDKGIIKIALPADAKILSFGLQNDQIAMWYEFKNYMIVSVKNRCVRIVNTGYSYPEFYNNKPFNFYTTLTTSNGIVWHCFAEGDY